MRLLVVCIQFPALHDNVTGIGICRNCDIVSILTIRSLRKGFPLPPAVKFLLTRKRQVGRITNRITGAVRPHDIGCLDHIYIFYDKAPTDKVAQCQYRYQNGRTCTMAESIQILLTHISPNIKLR